MFRGGGQPNLSSGFTLAEVLITLGIIGVIAAMTLPALIRNYNKSVVENRLKKFYTVMNQAVKLSEAEYGEFRYWDYNFNTSNVSGIESWWNKYFAPHVKTLKTEKTASEFYVYFVDNSKVKIFTYRGELEEGEVGGAIHLYFYPKANNKTAIMGKDYFTFFLQANTNKNKTLVEPYKFNWNGTRSHLINGSYGCRTNITYRHYCTALIQYENWTIPDDYPFTF